ncbi:MAG: acyl carrier protein [Candidatus Omnitrophica bacterium]|nr:acyl carrier protein [Candidatus Omnitrophota bacterium]MBU0896922.1 acyl carrier protein [Candidatus Omnitrophota bacterium]MBU1134318.1 acyl carrier protein [Candidatus Omnitrophota bacterium]MBU1811134.1 acyl carrier protein [Candidatus Omnitrophota bacterium]MBU2504892.1 acyl carrier protein [Candidatus Omnitrophota bacterium]
MAQKEIIKMTNEVFEEAFEIESQKLTPEANIFNDLGLDSLDVVDLVVALQKKFGVQIRNDERVRNIRTLGDIYGFIDALGEENKLSLPREN